MRAVGFLTQPFMVLNQVLLPSLALHRRESQARLADGTLRLNLISLCFLPAGFGGGVLLGQLLLHGFGEAYLDAQPVLVLLALVHSMNMAIVSPTSLIVQGRERAIAFVMVGALVVLYGGFAVLATSLTALGAAVVTLASLASTKVGYAALYRIEGLPLGDRRLLVAAAAVSAWLTALVVLPSPIRELALVVGAAVSALVTLRLMRATRVFAAARAA
jgi:O-antigen/teichoic acid export membrane protein